MPSSTESFKHAMVWAGYKFASTVLDDIWPGMVFFSGIATMVCCVSRFTGTNLGIAPTMLTVLGTVISLVVSFKTNNSYARWWEGRNVWANVTSQSRQLATLIWIQVPNVAPPKDAKGESKPGNKETSPDLSTSTSPPKDDTAAARARAASDSPDKLSTRSSQSSLVTGRESPIPAIPSESMPSSGGNERPRKWRKRVPSQELYTIDEDAEAKRKQREEERERTLKARKEMEGMVEKKTYIGLVQAFAVALKHSLRGEMGPFYSDLYSLIAFLPKYNPSAELPITRDHLLALWHNGIPRQKAHSADDVIALPLTHPAGSSACAYESHAAGEKPTAPRGDEEERPAGTTTASDSFKAQAVRSASRYAASDDPTILGFSRLGKGYKLVHEGDKGVDGGENDVTITTVELMPPRHPPAAKVWDFFPPLRLFKIMLDWFRKRSTLDAQERMKGGKRRRANATASRIPQEILMYLSAYMADLIRSGRLSTSLISPYMTALTALQQAITDLDKIATTPIPSAYTIQLRITVWIYLLFLPFQLYETLGWVTIPATAIAAVTYLGFMEIGRQIEMPFAYDQSDLDLDKYCSKLSEQIAEITAFPCTIPSSQIVLSHLNQPFLPSLSLTAPELLGLPEPTHRPSPHGLAEAYPDAKPDEQKAKAQGGEDEADAEDSPAASTDEGHGRERRMPKTMRDLELALTANWHEISAEAHKSLSGTERSQLENKTGLEVAVLAL